MTDTNSTIKRYQTAESVAGDAIDALLTAYWADSFDADLLQERLTETIAFFTRNALSLEEPHPHPELLEDDTQPAIATQQSQPTGKGV